MIGNDVVDLTTAAGESNWRRKGFLKKVFSAREREIIFGAGDHHQMVWLLWSMKEAAYKARQRAFSLPRLLDWQGLECQITQLDSKKAIGVVETECNRFFSISKLSSEVIHTTATNHPQTGFKNVVLQSSSEAIKKELLQLVAQHYSMAVSQLSITKNAMGVPAIAYENKEIFNRFSLSDHGRFAAFSLSLIIS